MREVSWETSRVDSLTHMTRLSESAMNKNTQIDPTPTYCHRSDGAHTGIPSPVCWYEQPHGTSEQDSIPEII